VGKHSGLRRGKQLIDASFSVGDVQVQFLNRIGGSVPFRCPLCGSTDSQLELGASRVSPFVERHADTLSLGS